MVSIELYVKRVNRVSVQHGLPNQALKFVPAYGLHRTPFSGRRLAFR